MKTALSTALAIAIGMLAVAVEPTWAGSFRDKVLALNPVAYWEFEGGYTDSSGYGNTLTPFGTAGLASGQYGQAANLSNATNGNGFYVNTPAGSSLNLTGNEWSINLWYSNAKSTNTSTGTAIMVNKRNGLTWLGKHSDYGSWMGWTGPVAEPNNYLVGTMSDGAGGFVYSSGPPLNPTPIPLDEANVWHMATTSWDHGTFSYYLDGKLLGGQTLGGVSAPSTYRMILGNADSPGTNSAPNNYWQGKLDEVAVFNKALHYADVAKLYADVAPPQGLARGHQILLQRGLQIEALSFAGITGVAEYFDPVRWAESNFTTAHIWADRFPVDIMPAAPGIPWSLTDYTDLGNIRPDEYPYASSMVSYFKGDETNINNPGEVARLELVMALMRDNQPHVITTSNVGWTPGDFNAQLNYMQKVKPDMLMGGWYPFNGITVGGSPTEVPAGSDGRLSFYPNLADYRTRSLIGVDGRPIPFGIFTQSFTHPTWNDHVVSGSEIRLNQFAAWAFGAKLVSNFTYEWGSFDPWLHSSVLFVGEGTANPTPQFYQVAETNRQGLNLGPALVRLITTDVRMKTGWHKEGSTNVLNTLPSGVSSWTASADPYIFNMSVTNLGSNNGGLRGDVILGYFKPLDPSFTNPGHEDDMYFMVVNGLTDPTGFASDCRQRIRLNFDFGDSGIDSLLRLSRETGVVEDVALVAAGGSFYYLNLYLDGGTGDLFKFNNGGTFVMPQPADFDGDGDVDGDDFLAWQASFGVDAGGDADFDGDTDGDDFLIWQSQFGSGSGSASAAVPEPSSWLLVAVGLAFCLTRRSGPHFVHVA